MGEGGKNMTKKKKKDYVISECPLRDKSKTVKKKLFYFIYYFFTGGKV